MSERSGRHDGSTRPSTNTRSADWTCHYCGASLAGPGQAVDARDALARHLRRECPDVPGPVRERYRRSRRSCPGGVCDG